VSFLYSLRLTRWGIAGFSALAFSLTLLQGEGFYAIAGHSAAERAAFGRSMAQIAAQFTVLIAAPIRPDTVGGYVQWRAYSFFAIVFGIWALASAYGAARGDEERGLVEHVLATGTSRADALIARFLAFAAGCTLAVLAAALGVIVAVFSGHESIGLDALAGASVNLLGLALCCYALTLLVCQFAATRYATAASAVVLLGLFLLNSLSRELDALAGWRWLSPFRYYDLSQPLPPNGTFDVRGIEVLFGSAAVMMVAATLAFAYRDLGAPLIRVPVAPHTVEQEPDRIPLWRVPVLRGLYDRRGGLLVWTLGVALLGVLFVILTKTIVQPLLGLAQLRPYFDLFFKGGIYPSFLSYIWFGFAQLLIAAYAITQVARWSAEDADGRLEAALSNPISRRSVLVERAAIVLVSALVIAAVSGVAVGVESHLQSIDLDRGRLEAASLLLVPVAMFFAAAGALLASFVPRGAVGLLGGFAFASYFLVQLGPLFRWPDWTLDISVFHLYGQPLSEGVDRGGLVIMLLVISVGFVAAALMMERRDLGA
jgi:polyether ionophore transport system permease protein